MRTFVFSLPFHHYQLLPGSSYITMAPSAPDGHETTAAVEPHNNGEHSGEAQFDDSPPAHHPCAHPACYLTNAHAAQPSLTAQWPDPPTSSAAFESTSATAPHLKPYFLDDELHFASTWGTRISPEPVQGMPALKLWVERALSGGSTLSPDIDRIAIRDPELLLLRWGYPAGRAWLFKTGIANMWVLPSNRMPTPQQQPPAGPQDDGH